MMSRWLDIVSIEPTHSDELEAVNDARVGDGIEPFLEFQ